MPELEQTLAKKLKLPDGFKPDAWRLKLIRKIKQRFDVIFAAGTAYGKSLIFEDLAATSKAGQVIIMITPLKALERDQVG